MPLLWSACFRLVRHTFRSLSLLPGCCTFAQVPPLPLLCSFLFEAADVLGLTNPCPNFFSFCADAAAAMMRLVLSITAEILINIEVARLPCCRRYRCYFFSCLERRTFGFMNPLPDVAGLHLHWWRRCCGCVYLCLERQRFSMDYLLTPSLLAVYFALVPPMLWRAYFRL